jgi:neutral ceramidase
MPFIAQYAGLPVEEKSKDKQSSATVHRSKWSTALTACVFSVLFLVSFTIIAGNAGSVKAQAAKVPVDGSQWLHSHTARATGDEYLLGVGKADITGYAHNRRVF